MGIAEIPIERLTRRKIGRPLRKPQFSEDSPINAFDTETRKDGKIYMLSYVYDNSNGSAVVGNQDFQPLDSDTLFSILTKKKARQPAVNVWYNLDFDANALFGTVLSENQMIDLADTNTTTFELNEIEYTLTYINGKFLSIKDDNRHSYTHFDISQFFNTSLNNASKDWLDIEKKDLDPTKAKQYDWEKVCEYAKRDAFITQQLWKKFVELGEHKLGIPLGKPISTGYIAQNVVFNELYNKPKWGSSQFQDMARKAYHGGRFEVYRRGFFDNVIGLDINSAYPFHMAKMPDLNSCDIQVIGGSVEKIIQADWGFVDCTVTTDKNRNIQPFPIKHDQVFYPALNQKRITVTKEEFLFALDNNYLKDYDIHKIGIVWENDNPKRPFSYLADWYEDRNEYKSKIEQKNDMNDKFQYILKVIMNSTYGKTCQITEKHERLEDKDFTPNKRQFVTEGYNNEMLKGYYEAGDLFNPFYASYITALTRLQLHKAVLDLGMEKDTIMLATDCLMIESDSIKQNQIDSMLEPKKLGKWDFDYEGSAFVIGSGVYDVMNDDKIIKLARRGFREVTKEWDSWRQAARKSNGEIVLTNERPARFKEWLLHEGHPRPAEFFEAERTLVPNFDKKRNWNQEATFENLLNNSHASKALSVKGE